MLLAPRARTRSTTCRYASLKCFRALPLIFAHSPGGFHPDTQPDHGNQSPFISFREDDDHRPAKLFGGICPVIDVLVPGAGDDRIEIETFGTGFLLVRPVPRRPKNQGQATDAPNDIQVFAWKILLAPVAR